MEAERERVAFRAVRRVAPAFLAAGRRRFATVRLRRVFFDVVRLPCAFVRTGDLVVELVALLALPPDRDRDERAGFRPEGVPFESAVRISRTSSMPAAATPRIMLMRSSWRRVERTLFATPDIAATFRLKVPSDRL